MTQLSFFQPPSWTVSDLSRYLRELLEGDYNLQDLWVQGEISNLSRPSSGHMYFTLKDGSAQLRCVMWRPSVQRLPFQPRDGDAIEAHGSISLYEAGGQYQLYADLLRPLGEGLLYQEFLRLKARLEAEGLFDPERKRSIPRWPHTIGIVTSPTGAALRDMLNILRRRYPLVRVVLASTQVQGDEAPPGIVAALEALNRSVHPDVILLARGGGSIEDLWSFNDERVARAIARSAAPVISGIGHETDFTIADFTADLRAPTPTAAAELATPDQVELRSNLLEQANQIQRNISTCLASYHWELNSLAQRFNLYSPLARVRSGRQRLDELERRLGLGLAYRQQIERARLSGLQLRLEALNPQAILRRGYAIVTHRDGSLVRTTAEVSAGEPLDVQVSDGTFGVKVEASPQAREVTGGYPVP